MTTLFDILLPYCRNGAFAFDDGGTIWCAEMLIGEGFDETQLNSAAFEIDDAIFSGDCFGDPAARKLFDIIAGHWDESGDFIPKH